MNRETFIRATQQNVEIADSQESASTDAKVFEYLFYEQHIPDFAAATLEQLYSNIYCTLERTEAYESLEGISTYVRRCGSSVETLIMFRKKNHLIKVVNQQSTFSEEQLSSFCKAIFSHYKTARVICFYALNMRLASFPFAFQQVAEIEENIIALPNEKSKYLEKIRPQFRKQLRNGNESIKAAHPTYSIELVSGRDIKEGTVDAILMHATKRMQMKGQSDYAAKVEKTILLKMLKKYGHIALATINDKVCGGAMWMTVGKCHFHQIAAHDPAYDQYMLGNQIWMAAILYCIELGGEECWLMGGASAHKARFHAQNLSFNSITVYRSKLDQFLNLQISVPCWATQQADSFKATAISRSTRQDRIGLNIRKAIGIIKNIRGRASSKGSR